jgi:lysyl-tRNA synthetase, class II
LSAPMADCSRPRPANSPSRPNRLDMITKSMRPLPEKFHGLTDVETRYRQRYVDLIVNPEVRETFRKRVDVIRLIREFLANRGFSRSRRP